MLFKNSEKLRNSQPSDRPNAKTNAPNQRGSCSDSLKLLNYVNNLKITRNRHEKCGFDLMAPSSFKLMDFEWLEFSSLKVSSNIIFVCPSIRHPLIVGNWLKRRFSNSKTKNFELIEFCFWMGLWPDKSGCTIARVPDLQKAKAFTFAYAYSKPA